ncbi:TPA: DeoR/GlpR transcriptional regulator [Providencia stuartii]|nr:DeoR/GlpR transcriptional regulator [Providencia stuartii]
MHKQARQNYIIEIIAKNGQVSVADLSNQLHVSADTIRRDLTELENQGLAQKNHGGAVGFNVPVMSRRGRNILLPEVKKQLGQQVAKLIPKSSTLFLDSGSTIMAVASFIQGPMKIITTSLDIATHFSDRTDIQLILLGGEWDPQQRLFSGSATLSMLARYRADIAILGACALHPTLGLSASEEADCDVKRAMIANSQMHWVVADSTKLNLCQPYLVANLDEIDQLFLDCGWDELSPNSKVTVNSLSI